MRRPVLGRAARIAQTELRRTWRKLRATTRGMLTLVGGTLALCAYGLVFGGAAYFGSGVLADADPNTAAAVATAGLLAAAGLVSFVVLQRSVKTTGDPDALDGLLTTVPAEDVAAGVVLAEACRVLVTVTVPLLAIAVGLALGTGSAVVAPTGLAVLWLLVLVATLFGYALGLLVKLVAATSAFVARHRAGLGAVAALALPVSWLAVTAAPSAQRRVIRALTDSPLTWLADIVFLSTPGIDGDPLSAAAATGAVLGAVPVLAVTCLALAKRLWYVDPVQPDHEFDADERTLSDRVLRGRVQTATRVVAQKSWLRAKRAPVTVQFAVFPFLFLVSQLQLVLWERQIPPTLPVTAGLAAAAAAGAAFTLNPLGGEERVLPMTLTADVSGRAFVTGLVLAGALPGLAGATLLVLGLGLAAGTALPVLLAALWTVAVATAAAPAIAAGAGVIFPKLESTSVRNRDVVVPSGWASGLYGLAFAVTVAPASTAVTVAIRGASAVPVDTGLLLAGGLVATTALAVAGAVAGFLYAANRVGTYRLD